MARRRFINQSNNQSNNNSDFGESFRKMLIFGTITVIGGFICRDIIGFETESTIGTIFFIVIFMSGIATFIYFIKWFFNFIQ
jgi:hypothetical protein